MSKRVSICLVGKQKIKQSQPTLCGKDVYVLCPWIIAILTCYKCFCVQGILLNSLRATLVRYIFSPSIQHLS